jgi:hypothetical protein
MSKPDSNICIASPFLTSKCSKHTENYNHVLCNNHMKEFFGITTKRIVLQSTSRNEVIRSYAVVPSVKGHIPFPYTVRLRDENVNPTEFEYENGMGDINYELEYDEEFNEYSAVCKSNDINGEAAKPIISALVKYGTTTSNNGDSFQSHIWSRMDQLQLNSRDQSNPIYKDILAKYNNMRVILMDSGNVPRLFPAIKLPIGILLLLYYTIPSVMLADDHGSEYVMAPSFAIRIQDRCIGVVNEHDKLSPHLYFPDISYDAPMEATPLILFCLKSSNRAEAITNKIGGSLYTNRQLCESLLGVDSGLRPRFI